MPGFDGTDRCCWPPAMLGRDGDAARGLPAFGPDPRPVRPDRSPDPPAAGCSRRPGSTSVLAMVLAGAVNIAMLLLAASGLRGQRRRRHHRGRARRGQRHRWAGRSAVLFAVGLLASGLASTSVGCYAGAVIMEGLLRRRVNLLLRRVITLIPALVILAVGADPTTVLVISQVVLSFGLPFVLIPLMRLTSDRKLMGDDVNRPCRRRRLDHHHRDRRV